MPVLHVLCLNCHDTHLFPIYFSQYVSEVVIGAPYAVTESLMNHFNVSTCIPMHHYCWSLLHYKNIQYAEIFKRCKKIVRFFRRKFFYTCILFTLVQNINCGYTLELPQRGGCYEYPQCMF